MMQSLKKHIGRKVVCLAVENLVVDATSNSAWGPSVFVMSVIAEATYNEVVCKVVMSHLWSKLCDFSCWRQIEKCIDLLEYLLKTGAPKICQDCRKKKTFLERLFLKNMRRTEGNVNGCCEKLENIFQLLDDDKLKAKTRTEALKEEMEMCRFCVEQGIDIGAQNPVTQWSAPIQKRLDTMTKAFLKAANEKQKLCEDFLEDIVLAYNQRNGQHDRGDVDIDLGRGLRKQENGKDVSPHYSTISISSSDDQSESLGDLIEDCNIAYQRL